MIAATEPHLIGYLGQQCPHGPRTHLFPVRLQTWPPTDSEPVHDFIAADTPILWGCPECEAAS